MAEAHTKGVELATRSLSDGRRRMCNGVYRSCAAWAAQQKVEMDEHTAVCFVAARAMDKDCPSGRTLAGYAGALRTILAMKESPSLAQLAKGLRREAAEEDTVKALPLCVIDQVRVPRLLPDLALPIWLAIETSSRWDEITRLRRENFVTDWSRTPGEIVVTWATTKAEQEGTTRTDHTTLIRPPFPPTLVQWLKTAPANEPLTRVTTRQITERLRDIVPWEPALPGPGQRLRERYTAHSFKRTGVDRDVMAAAAAEKEVPGSGAELLRRASVRAKHLSVDNTRGYTTKVREWAMAAAGAKL